LSPYTGIHPFEALDTREGTMMERTRGQAILQYALIAALLAVAMLAAMTYTKKSAGNDIVSTQNGLANEANAP